MEQDKKDWDLHPENYRTENDDGITFILKKDGTPKKKAGRPKGATSNYNYHSKTKAKLSARRSVRTRQKRISIPNRVSINERAELIRKEVAIGNLEGDLTFNKGNQSRNIGGLVDIRTQKLFLTLNKSKRTKEVIGNMNKKLKNVKHLIKTIAFDNGKEFTNHAKLLPKDLKAEALENINKFLDSKKDVVWDIGEQQWLGILESNLKTFETSFDDEERERHYKVIKKHTKLLDLNRGQHIKDYIPKLEKFIYE